MTAFFTSRRSLVCLLCLMSLTVFSIRVFRKGEVPLGEDAWGREALRGPSLTARDLLTPQSFEVVALYLYAQDYHRGIENPWTKGLLKACSECLDGLWQRVPDFQARQKAFHRIFDSVRDGELSPQTAAQMTQPAGLAAVLLFHPDAVLEEGTPEFPGKVSLALLKERGLETRYLDALALEYARISPDCYFSVLLPRGHHQLELVREGIREIGDLVYDKEIYLHDQGPYNYLQHTYGYLCAHPHNWIHDQKRIQTHISKRFTTDDPLHVFLFRCQNWRQVRPWKLKMRALAGMGTRAIHATDSYDETVALAQVYFNENTLHFLNYSLPVKNQNFRNLLKHFRERLEKEGRCLSDFCLDGNSVLAAFGLDDHDGDFDFVDFRGCPGGAERQAVADLVFNPDHYFYFCGLKFATLNYLHRSTGSFWKQGVAESLEDFQGERAQSQ